MNMINNTWTGKSGVLLIAEIGGNHEGDFEYAKRLTQLAIDSGADCVKFQLYEGDTLVSSVESPDRNRHFKKFELSREQHLKLANMCKESNVQYMASVWDPEYVSWIDEYIDVYKIGSGDFTAYPVIKKFVELGKPLLLSTGLCSIQEVVETVEYIQGLDERYKSSDYLSILQCTSMYPIPPEGANLNVMNSLRLQTNLTVGYSDHTEGSEALEIAVAMGAQILEFDFTDDREGKEFRDHKVSLTKEEVQYLIEKIKLINRYKGSSLKRPLDVEGDHLVTFRRACYPKVDLKSGDMLTEDNLTVLRPNVGIDAREFDELIGKKINVSKKKHERLNWEEIDV